MRKLNKQNYYIAAILTLAIFVLGLLLGLVIEEKRTRYVEDKYEENRIIYSSSQLQYDFLSMLDDKDLCPGVYKTFYTNVEELETIRIKLESYSEDAMLNKESFELLEREYLLQEIRYWMLARKTQELCKNDIVTVLNFFSSDSECPRCNEQNFILTYLKKKFGDRLLIFSFNCEVVKEPMVEILMSTYGVSEFPALVIEGKTFQGFNDKEKLMEIICSGFNNLQPECIEISD
ncbi:hypothetical protein JXB31_02935 [Candidatus Woesearchaeota archaeon]|nr:hypothetical protein [Candidatus Woesearchaeota archaeon]